VGLNLEGLGTIFAASGAAASGAGGVMLAQAGGEPIDPLGLVAEEILPPMEIDLVTIALGGALGYGIGEYAGKGGNGLVGGLIGAVAAPLLRSTLGV